VSTHRKKGKGSNRSSRSIAALRSSRYRIDSVPEVPAVSNVPIVNRFKSLTSDLSEDGFDFRKRQESAWLKIRTSRCAWLPLRGYFLRLFNRIRSSFIDKVDSFRLASINFQKLGEVCRATSAQSLPSTPTRMAAGLPRRVMTTLSCWDISTHSLILFCKSRALTVFIKHPQSWSREASFERREHRPPTRP
jgi:hypothetical protein